MSYLSDAIAVSSRFLVFFLFVPFLFTPRAWPWPDRLLYGFTGAAVVSVIVGQLFAALHLFEPLSLVGLVIAGAALAVVRSLKPGWSLRLMQRVDELEDRHWNLLPYIARWLARLWARARAGLRQVVSLDLPAALLMIYVLTWAAYLRYDHYLRHAWLGAPDAYVHLTWTKYLQGSKMYHDGVYPFGYHAILGVFGTLTFLNPVQIIRFVGPLGGMLLLLSLAYASAKLGMRFWVIVVVVALIGLGFGSPLPANPFRQSEPLPQEFAAAFVLPALVLAWEYLRTGRRSASLAMAALVYLIASIHPYPLIYLAMAVAVLAAVSLVLKIVPFARVRDLALAAAAAVVLGALPMGIGRLLGIPWHSSFLYVVSSVQRLTPAPGLARVFSANPFLDAGLLLVVGLVAWAVVLLRRGERPEAALRLTVGIQLLFLYTQAYGRTGVPVIMDPVRSGLFFSLFLALALGMVLQSLSARVQLGRIAGFVTAGILVWAFVGFWPPVPAGGVQSEYDSAAQVYLDIDQNHLPRTWTIVSPTEQYSEVLLQGWHQELGHFLTRVTASDRPEPGFTLEDVRSPNFKLYIDTPDVFVYVERIPVGSTQVITPNADETVKLSDMLDQDTIAFYYNTPSLRATLERRVWGIMEAYRQALAAEKAKGIKRPQADEISVYYESPELIVYHIQRTAGNLQQAK